MSGYFFKCDNISDCVSESCFLVDQKQTKISPLQVLAETVDALSPKKRILSLDSACVKYSLSDASRKTLILVFAV